MRQKRAVAFVVEGREVMATVEGEGVRGERETEETGGGGHRSRERMPAMLIRSTYGDTRELWCVRDMLKFGQRNALNIYL